MYMCAQFRDFCAIGALNKAIMFIMFLLANFSLIKIEPQWCEPKLNVGIYCPDSERIIMSVNSDEKHDR